MLFFVSVSAEFRTCRGPSMKPELGLLPLGFFGMELNCSVMHGMLRCYHVPGSEGATNATKVPESLRCSGGIMRRTQTMCRIPLFLLITRNPTSSNLFASDLFLKDGNHLTLSLYTATVLVRVDQPWCFSLALLGSPPPDRHGLWLEST